MDLDTSDNTVSVIHFIRLLKREDRKRVKIQGRTLVLTDSDGSTHELPLTPRRRLNDWPRAFELLGYSKRQNIETGVIDYSVPDAVASSGTVGQPKELDSQAVRLERSRRRPGYIRAKKNFDKFLRLNKVSDDEVLRSRVDRIGQLIAAQSPLSGIVWNFEVVDVSLANAFCTGEGHVLVTRGFLDLGLTDDELAGVLGHEVAHGVRRHTEIYEERFNEFLAIRKDAIELQRERQREESDRNNSKIKILQSKLKNKENRLDFILNYLRNKKDYDQDEEEEADVLGTQYAVAAGFDAEGEARALVKLQKHSVKVFGQSNSEGSRTHPPLARRLKILETVRRRWRESRHNR